MKKDNVLYVLFKPFYFKMERKTAEFYHDYLFRKSNNINYLSELEEELMTKAKETTKGKLVKEIEKLDKQIIEELGEFDINIKNKSNWELIFSLIPTPILKELYDRLEEGDKAIEENKRIKASLDNVNEAIKKMFKLV